MLEMDLDKELLLHKLNQIGIALSGERNLDKLLDKILTEARLFTHAEGASLYIKEGDFLRFMVTQNEILAKQLPEGQKFVFSQELLPLSDESMAGYVALTGKILNIEDAYNVPSGSPYHFNPSFDQLHGYRTRSMLIAPMKDPQGNVIGVLALINARNQKQEVIPFDRGYEPLILSLASQATVAYINARLTHQLKSAYLDTVFRLAMAAECREPDIKGHLHRISSYSAILAEELGLSAQEIEYIRYASPMHDIGKIGITDAVLLKPGKLTEEEYEEMKKHTIYGAKILSRSDADILKLSEQIALTHHEYYDGSGYPQGLQGDQIPLVARIVTLADVFDALASRRAYKDSWDFQEIVNYIKERSGIQFDPKVVAAFERRFQDFFEIYERYRYSEE